MFTDGPTTPVRVEVALTLFKRFASKWLDRQFVCELLQPESLPDFDAGRNASKQTILALAELQLVEEKKGKYCFRKPDKSKLNTREIVVTALDTNVLSKTDIEPYFAPFYSYLLGLNDQGAVGKSNDTWAKSFERDVQGGIRSSNPFNATKLTGINRWLTYCGLGWRDPDGVFQPNPYFRVKRTLAKIFGKQKSVTGGVFMERLADFCPELDGGKIFNQTNPDNHVSSEECTLGLSSALVELHIDGVIRLDCPRDARGWSIVRAKPPYDDHIKGIFVDSVELLKS